MFPHLARRPSTLGHPTVATPATSCIESTGASRFITGALTRMRRKMLQASAWVISAFELPKLTVSRVAFETVTDACDFGGERHIW